MNAAYVEKTSNYRRPEKFDDQATSVVVNTELAGLGDGGGLRRFMTEFDKRMDRISASPGKRMYVSKIPTCLSK